VNDSYNALTELLRGRSTLVRMELHFIADDLEEHTWYVELVADFVDDVRRFAAAQPGSRDSEIDSGVDYRPASGSDPM
jgi:hypothetical protein